MVAFIISSGIFPVLKQALFMRGSTRAMASYWSRNKESVDSVHFGSSSEQAPKEISHRAGPKQIARFEQVSMEQLVNGIPEDRLDSIINATHPRSRVLAIVLALEAPFQSLIDRARQGEHIRLTFDNEKADGSMNDFRRLLSIRTGKPVHLREIAAVFILLGLQYPEEFKSSQKGYVFTQSEIVSKQAILLQAIQSLRSRLANESPADLLPSINDLLQVWQLKRMRTNQLVLAVNYQRLIDEGIIRPVDLGTWDPTKDEGPMTFSKMHASWADVPFVQLKPLGSEKGQSILRRADARLGRLTIPEQLLPLVLRIATVLQQYQYQLGQICIFNAKKMAPELNLARTAFRDALHHRNLITGNNIPLFIFENRIGTHVNPEYPPLNQTEYKRILGADWEAKMAKTQMDTDNILNFLEANIKLR